MGITPVLLNKLETPASRQFSIVFAFSFLSYPLEDFNCLMAREMFVRAWRQAGNWILLCIQEKMEDSNSEGLRSKAASFSSVDILQTLSDNKHWRHTTSEMQRAGAKTGNG